MPQELKDNIVEEFRKEFWGRFVDKSVYEKLEKQIANWWLSKLDQAYTLGAQDKLEENVWCIEDLKGFPANLISEYQAEEIIKLLKQ